MQPELLAPAGSLDAVRAAVANGADSVYLGAERFNARDEGAQLTLDELAQACRLAHERGVRVYLTLNTLVKPGEVADCLTHLGECIDRGIDAAIVHDVGIVGLIQRVYPGFEIHGSTQMTVHDPSGAAFALALGVQRVVLARENTLDDIRAIREAVPALGLELFVHGALCVSYSGQCFMSGMISERSANRGLCAQSCRKDYVLTDAATGDELDRGYLISAKDLAAHEHLPSMVDAGIVALKIEGRKKKAEYVATATRTYRDLIDRIRRGDRSPATVEQTTALVQIFSRGFTGGMLGGRVGRGYVTRTHSDNHGAEVGVVVGCERGELTVLVSTPLRVGDGVGLKPAGSGVPGESTGFTVDAVRTHDAGDGLTRQTLRTRVEVPIGWKVVRSFDAEFTEQARASYLGIALPEARNRGRIDIRLCGSAGVPLDAVFTVGDDDVAVHSDVPLAPASKRSLDNDVLRAQLGRLGGTDFVLGTVDRIALGDGLFLPVSELNRMRQRATDALAVLRERTGDAAAADRAQRIGRVIRDLSATTPVAREGAFTLSANVYAVDDARVAASSGATEVVFDPFLRHPAPPRARITALAAELAGVGVTLRLRTPTIVRPDERRALDPWLALGLPILSGHAGLAVELAAAGRDVVADYAVNAFNAHTAAAFFERGVRRVVASVELTGREIDGLGSPWHGRGIDVVVYGRPEGMILEHCVLSAAFDREVMTCRDLCLQKHPVVELTDPTGYTFPVATDSACRNRLLHSRPIEASEYIESLWESGIRGFHLVFNVAGDPVAELVVRYRGLLDALAEGRSAEWASVRELVGTRFTRGHFARAV